MVKVALLGLGSSVQCPRWEAGTGLHWSPGGGTPSGMERSGVGLAGEAGEPPRCSVSVGGGTG